MSCVMGGLLDQVQNRPSEIERLRETKKNMRGWAVAFPAETGDFEVRSGPNQLFGALLLFPVDGDHIGQGDVIADLELLLSRWELGLAVTPFDPPPFGVGEMVDDPDDREESTVGRPPRLLLGQVGRGGDDLFALTVKEPKQQLPLVRGGYHILKIHRHVYSFGRRDPLRRGSPYPWRMVDDRAPERPEIEPDLEGTVADDGTSLDDTRHYLQDPSNLVANARDADEQDQDELLDLDQTELEELGLTLDDPHQPEPE